VQFKSVRAAEAKEMADSGEYVVIDVRPIEDFEKSTIQDAKSVPLFQRISFSNPSPGKLLRGLAYALNGVQAVEVNPDFEEQMKAAAGGKKVLLVRSPPYRISHLFERTSELTSSASIHQTQHACATCIEH
jgi:rhodanese-related sulfurtransferase